MRVRADHAQKISGYYTPGTFQQYVLGPANYVTPIPDGLDSAAAAPLLCAGVTVYAALRKTNAESGNFVVIMGAGGGLGHLAVRPAFSILESKTHASPLGPILCPRHRPPRHRHRPLLEERPGPRLRRGALHPRRRHRVSRRRSQEPNRRPRRTRSRSLHRAPRRVRRVCQPTPLWRPRGVRRHPRGRYEAHC